MTSCVRNDLDEVAEIDPARPSEWTEYREGACEGCRALCCSLPVETTPADWQRLGWVSSDGKKLVAEGKLERSPFFEEVFLLARDRRTGFCRLLDLKTRRCTRYADRPEPCRDFPSIGPRPGCCPQAVLRRP